jgi:hypothetical protein
MERSAAHVVRILDQSGDTTLTYDPSDPAGVDEIEQRFARLMERNFVAFDVSAATEIIVSPRFAGG